MIFYQFYFAEIEHWTVFTILQNLDLQLKFGEGAGYLIENMKIKNKKRDHLKLIVIHL